MIYEIWKEWDECRQWMLPALEKCPTHNEDDVLIALVKGEMKLWKGQRSAMVTEVITTPRAKFLNFFLIGGDLEELREMKGPIEAWGASRGCRWAEGTGRNGWERALPDYKKGGARAYKGLVK